MHGEKLFSLHMHSRLEPEVRMKRKAGADGNRTHRTPLYDVPPVLKTGAVTRAAFAPETVLQSTRQDSLEQCILIPRQHRPQVDQRTPILDPRQHRRRAEPKLRGDTIWIRR